MRSLSVDEKIRLSHYEAEVEQGRQQFHRSIVALKNIYDEELWSEAHASFKDYWQTKWSGSWGFDWNYAYKLVEAARVIQNLSGCTVVQLQNEAQTRPLKPLPPEQQIEAVNAAATIAPDQKPNSGHINRAVAAVKSKPELPQPGQTVTVTDESSPHYLKQAEVVSAQGVIVECKVEGETKLAPFLCNEVSSSPKSEKSSSVEQVWASKPKTNPLEALQTELEIEQLRVDLLERALNRLIQAIEAPLPHSLEQLRELTSTLKSECGLDTAA